jgi:SAM-dependent methyltransferase
MDDSLYEEMAGLQSAHWWYRARRRILASEIARMGLLSNANILEAGCGPGGNLAMLAKFGTVAAIEPYQPARQVAADLNIADVQLAGLPGPLPFERKFDLIAAFDVIEHIREDLAALKSLRSAMAPKGWLLLTVPAYQWLWSQHDVRNHHQRRYTRTNFCRLVEAAGFEVKRSSYFNSHLFPVIAGVRLAQKAFGSNGASNETMPSQAINKILESIFAFERWPLSLMNYPFGVSIMLSARVPQK